MANILITGGAGFIGSQLGYKLHKQGHVITLLDNMSYGHEDNLNINGETFGNFILDDIRNSSLNEHMKNIDYVYHFAGIAPLPNCQENPYEAVDVNVGGTANVLECARQNKVKRVIFSSTSALYENNKINPFKESDNINPDLIYSTTKWQAEKLCQSFYSTYQIPIVILRFFNVYGPHQDFKRKHPPLTGYLIKEFLTNGTPILHSNGEQRRDYIYVDDLLDICNIVMTNMNAIGEIFNVASGKTISVNFYNTNNPIYQSSDKFWNKYPNLFTGSYPLQKIRLIKEVEKFSLGCTVKSKKYLNWSAKTSYDIGFKNSVNYAKKIGI